MKCTKFYHIIPKGHNSNRGNYGEHYDAQFVYGEHYDAQFVYGEHYDAQFVSYGE